MPSTFHNDALELAVEVQRQSRAKYASAPENLIRGALFAISLDSLRVHRAIGSRVDSGWAGESGSLLRTLFELNISAVAVVNSADAQMAAFRYFYSGLRRHYRDQRFDPSARKRMFAQIRERLAQLPPDQRQGAVSVLREKDRPFWYAAEFGTPSDVLRRFADEELVWVYAQLSAAAHGGFLGLRMYRDDPDLRDLDPKPLGKRALSVDLQSTRFITELLDVRARYEGLDVAGSLATLRTALFQAVQELKGR